MRTSRLIATGILGGGNLRYWTRLSPQITPTLGAELWDAGAATFESGIYGWYTFGTNSIENDAGALKCTYVNNSTGPEDVLKNAADLSVDPTVGQWYQVSYEAKVNTGSVTPIVLPGGGISFTGAAVTATAAFAPGLMTFPCGSATLGLFRMGSLGAGEIVWLDNTGLKQIDFASMFAYSGDTKQRPNSYQCTPTVAVRGTQVGMALAWADANNFVLAYVDGLNARLEKYINGTRTNIITAAVTYGAGKALKVTVESDDQTYKLWYDGVQVGTDQIIDPATLGTKVYGFSTHAGNEVGTMTTAPFDRGLTLLKNIPGWWVGNDGTTYIYGNDGGQRIVWRRTEDAETYETMGNVTTLDVNYRIKNIFPATTPGLIFVLVQHNTTLVYHILRSADGGLTFANVLTLGGGNGLAGADSPQCRILPHGFCEVTVAYPGGGGVGDLLIGEYTAISDATRVPGSTYDRTRMLRSTDGGLTWASAWQWNTDGSTNQVRHIHCVKQDPYTGYIWLSTGDDLDKGGLIRWDGASDLPDNTPIPNVNAVPGFVCKTNQRRYCTVDIAFTPDWLFVYSDVIPTGDPLGTEGGIWRGSKDLATYERMAITRDWDVANYGWDAFCVNDVIVWTAIKYVGWTQMQSPIYLSSGQGTVWKKAAFFNWLDQGNIAMSTRYAHAMNGRIYLDNNTCVEGGTNVWEPTV